MAREIHALRITGSEARVEKVADAPARISALGTDAEGRLYLAGHDNGVIYRLTGPDLEPPTR